jgi:hypothetical protein
VPANPTGFVRHPVPVVIGSSPDVAIVQDHAGNHEHFGAPGWSKCGFDLVHGEYHGPFLALVDLSHAIPKRSYPCRAGAGGLAAQCSHQRVALARR